MGDETPQIGATKGNEKLRAHEQSGDEELGDEELR